MYTYVRYYRPSVVEMNQNLSMSCIGYTYYAAMLQNRKTRVT